MLCVPAIHRRLLYCGVSGVNLDPPTALVPLSRSELILVLQRQQELAPSTWMCTSYYARLEPAMLQLRISPADVVNASKPR